MIICKQGTGNLCRFPLASPILARTASNLAAAGGRVYNMFNVCPSCGLYRVDKAVTEPAGVVEPASPNARPDLPRVTRRAVAACPHCGHNHPLLRQPLLLVGGASATGKSAILQQLTGRVTAAVLLEADLLWLQEFENPTDGHRRFFETWLRLAKNIGQSGRPAVLFGAGLAVPENIEPCLERRYFSRVHYLALVCDEDELRRRLLARPAWRGSGQQRRLKEQLDFNQWLQEEGPNQSPPLTLLDTTDATIQDSADAVKDWIARLLEPQAPAAP